MNIRLISGALLGAALLSGMALVGPLAREARGNFILWDDQQMTVNTTHAEGSLYDTSRAFIVFGGSVQTLDAYTTSTVDISGGHVGSLTANNTSTVDMSGGSVDRLFVYNTSTVDMSGGSVGQIYPRGTGIVAISGGSVSTIAIDSGYAPTVAISGGSVSHLYPNLLRPGGGSINISGGTVDILSASITLTGVEQLHISTGPTLALLATYGVTVTPGTVSNLMWHTVMTHDSSSVDMSSGSVDTLFAYDSSTVDMSGGSVGSYINASGKSTVDMSGGSVGSLRAHNTSTVDMSGGSVSDLYARDTSVVTFHGRDFSVHGALQWDGDRVLGTGLLTGEWTDGTLWAVNIMENDAGATIRAIPDPATLSLLALGGALALLRRRSASA